MNQGPVSNNTGITVQADESCKIPAHFVWRRLHSLTGIIPLGIYLLIHIFIGTTAIAGKDAYNSLQSWVNRIPLLVPLEIIVIVIPLAFHAIYGFLISLRERGNAFTYPYLDNWRYSLQRLSGYYLVVFLAIHLGHFWLNARFTEEGRELFNSSPFDFVSAQLGNHSYMVIYSLAVVAASFHLCQGIWTFCNTWGITISDRSRLIVGLAVGILFALLVYFGFRAVLAFYAGHPPWPLPDA